MIGDRAWCQTHGIWAGMPSGAITAAGAQNVWSNATGPGQALILVHNNWINITTDADGGLDDFSSNHPGGINLLFADGSVHFLQNSIDVLTFQRLGARGDGQTVSLP